MSNKTINKLLYATMGVLFIGICFLLFKISTRPHYISTSDTVEVATIPELDTQSVTLSSTNTEDSSLDENTDFSEQQSTLRGKASSMVNIRELPSTDSRVLETVDKDHIFDIIEILSDGWTKIKYGDSEAYVSSQFVILIQN